MIPTSQHEGQRGPHLPFSLASGPPTPQRSMVFSGPEKSHTHQRVEEEGEAGSGQAQCRPTEHNAQDVPLVQAPVGGTPDPGVQEVWKVECVHHDQCLVGRDSMLGTTRKYTSPYMCTIRMQVDTNVSSYTYSCARWPAHAIPGTTFRGPELALQARACPLLAHRQRYPIPAQHRWQ